EGPWVRAPRGGPHSHAGRLRRERGDRDRGRDRPRTPRAAGCERRAHLFDRMARGGRARRARRRPAPATDGERGGDGMKTTVIGAFPKISDQAGGQELRQALHKQDRGELKESELDAVYDAVTRGAIGELEAAGID